MTGAVKRFSKAEALIVWANSRVGCPYLPKTKGVICTPYVRTDLSRRYPRAAPYIKKSCALHSGKIAACRGFWDEGKRCPFFDHAQDDGRPGYGPLQLVSGGFDEAKIRIPDEDAVMFLSDERVSYRGVIASLPDFPIVCVVFNVSIDTGHVSRIGIFDGSGDDRVVFYVKNYRDGVVREPYQHGAWSHWAFISALYEDDKATADRIFEHIDEYATKYTNKPYEAIVHTGGVLSLNVRRLSGTTSGIIGQVGNGETLFVLRELNDKWAKVSYNDMVGYAQLQYLKRIKT